MLALETQSLSLNPRSASFECANECLSLSSKGTPGTLLDIAYLNSFNLLDKPVRRVTIRTPDSGTADCGAAVGLLTTADAVNISWCQASNSGNLTLELQLLATPLNCPVEIGLVGWK